MHSVITSLLLHPVISGILYDKFSPSAILNIEGTDYLVKKGDVVNNYKVLNILEDSVTVKLGENVYKIAGRQCILNIDGTAQIGGLYSYTTKRLYEMYMQNIDYIKEYMPVDEIKELNNDDYVNGIMISLPIPEKYNEKSI